MSNFTFLKTSAEMDAGIPKVILKVSELDAALKEYGIASAQYALLDKNYSYLHTLYNGLVDKHQTMFRAWITQKNSPFIFNIKEGTFAISENRVKALTKNLGDDVKEEVQQAFLWGLLEKALTENSWSTSLKKASAEKILTEAEQREKEAAQVSKIRKAAGKFGYKLVMDVDSQNDTVTRHNTQATAPAEEQRLLPDWIEELATTPLTDEQEASIKAYIAAITAAPAKKKAA